MPAVWEASLSRHNGGPIKNPFKPPNTILLWCTGGIRGALYWAPTKPRDVSLSMWDAAARIAGGNMPLNGLCRTVRSTFAVRETQSLGQQMLNGTVGINGFFLGGNTPLDGARARTFFCPLFDDQSFFNQEKICRVIRACVIHLVMLTIEKKFHRNIGKSSIGCSKKDWLILTFNNF